VKPVSAWETVHNGRVAKFTCKAYFIKAKGENQLSLTNKVSLCVSKVVVGVHHIHGKTMLLDFSSENL
jgi:hypothetical protein